MCDDDTAHVEDDVLGHDDVPKPGETIEPGDQLWRESLVVCKRANRADVVIEPDGSARGELRGDVNHHLTDREQREEHVVVEGEVALEVVGRPHPGSNVAQMIEMPPQLRRAARRETSSRQRVQQGPAGPAKKRLQIRRAREHRSTEGVFRLLVRAIEASSGIHIVADMI